MGMWQNYFLKRNSNTNDIYTRKTANSQQNPAVFSAATDSENVIIQILHGKGQIKKWTELSSLGQEPTFNNTLTRTGNVIDNVHVKYIFSD